MRLPDPDEHHTMRVRVAVAAATLILTACGGGSSSPEDPVARGDELFHGEATCEVCHGPDLQGTTMGPPLIDRIYAPDHHPDASIRRAIQNGVQPHHWDFGPMPALSHLDDEDIDALIAYIRSRQEAAGITRA